MGPRRQTVNAPRETKTHISQTSYNEVRSERTFSMASIRNSHEKVISSSIDSTGPLHENPSMIITPSPRKSNDVKHKTQLQKKGTVISPDDVLVALDKYAIDENSPQNDLNNRPATNLLDTESMKETQRRLFSKFVPPFPHRESIDESTPVKNKAKGSQHRDPVDSSLEDDFDFITRLRMAASNDEFENESDETHHHERFNDDSTPDKTNYLEKVNVDSTADGTEVTLFALNKLNILEDDDERVAALSWEDVDDRSGTSETAEHKAVSQVHEHTDGKALFPQDDTNANMIDVSAENSFLGTPTKGKDIDEPKGLFSMPLCGTDCYVETPEKSMQYNQSNFFSSNVQEMEGWCGNDLYCTENPFNSKREIIEKSIGKLLTTEGSWCNGWHMWGLYLDDEKPVDIPMDPVVIRGIFQNRAGNLKGRSRRIKTLHHNIAPFQQYHKDHFSELKKSSSFGIEKINSLKSQSSSTSSFLGIQACMRPDPSKMVIDEYQEELCYDSDPGTISRERTRDVFTVSNHETRSHDSPIMLRQRNRRKRMADSFQSHNPSFKSIERINLNDAATVTSLVQVSECLNSHRGKVFHSLFPFLINAFLVTISGYNE